MPKLNVGDKVNVYYHYSRYPRPKEGDVYLWQKRPDMATVSNIHFDSVDNMENDWPDNITLVFWTDGYIEDYSHVKDNVYDNGMEEVYREFPSVVRIEKLEHNEVLNIVMKSKRRGA